MKLFASTIVVVPFFFSLVHGMEEKQQQDIRTLDMAQLKSSSTLNNSILKTLSTEALDSFVEELYKPDNLRRCKKVCKKFSDEVSKQNNSDEFKNLLKKDWEKEYPKN